MRRYTAIVVGGAECVVADFKAAMAMFTPDAVYGVNDIGAHLEKLDVWCSLHPECMDKWQDERRRRGLSSDYEIVLPPDPEVGSDAWAFKKGRRVSYRWPNMNSSASSGIFGAKVAMEDGYSRIVLAGIPMSADAGHFMPKSKNSHGKVRGHVWQQHAAFIGGFVNSVPHLMGKVKSMSGYTQKILGEPTPEWLTS